MVCGHSASAIAAPSAVLLQPLKTWPALVGTSAGLASVFPLSTLVSSGIPSTLSPPAFASNLTTSVPSSALVTVIVTSSVLLFALSVPVASVAVTVITAFPSRVAVTSPVFASTLAPAVLFSAPSLIA